VLDAITPVRLGLIESGVPACIIESKVDQAWASATPALTVTLTVTLTDRCL
jgi:hypothetical protein